MKKIAALALATVMALSSFSAFAIDYGDEYENRPQRQSSQSFSDVPATHWHLTI